jgi:autotransporter-associated beta strand protein
MFSNTAVTLEAAASGNTLTLQGASGNDLSIPAGCSFTIGNGANAMNLTFTGAGNATNADGTLTLSNANPANSYNTTNSTTLITGTFNIGGAVTGNFANNGLVNFTRTSAYSHSGIISGTGAVTVSGSGPITLSEENTYSGGTTINAGTALTVGNGATAGAIWSSSGIVNNGTLTFNRSDNITYSGPISGTGMVNQSGTGVLTLSAMLNQAGNLNINAGSLELADNARLELSGDFNITTGILIPNTSTQAFTGSGNSTISGNLSLYNVEVNKTGSAQKLSLGSNISVSNQVNMQSGDLDLNGYQLDMGSTGSLVNETAANCVTGTSGGTIRAVRSLNAPSAVNVGGLGAILTSAADLGSTEIIRRHNQAVSSLTNYGINRRYEIHPTNNSSLNATLVFNYFDAELNTAFGNIAEVDLVLWRDGGSGWEFQGGTVDLAANTITKTGIPQFSEWTSGAFDTPLPLTLRDLKVSCGDQYPQLAWRSLKEENTSRFEVEISSDGNSWELANVVQAARNSESMTSYRLDLDKFGRSAGYVRLVLRNEDGSREVFGPLAVNCRGPLDDETFRLYPNPARGLVSLNLKSLKSGSVQVRVFNTLGAEVFQQVHDAETGNEVSMDLSGLPAGIYQVEAALEGQNQRSLFKLIIQ